MMSQGKSKISVKTFECFKMGEGHQMKWVQNIVLPQLQVYKLNSLLVSSQTEICRVIWVMRLFPKSSTRRLVGIGVAHSQRTFILDVRSFKGAFIYIFQGCRWRSGLGDLIEVLQSSSLWPNRYRIARLIEAYSEPCQTSKMERF